MTAGPVQALATRAMGDPPELATQACWKHGTNIGFVNSLKSVVTDHAAREYLDGSAQIEDIDKLCDL